jgi:hypothetical protein
MARATWNRPGADEADDRRLPVAAGASPEDLERVVSSLEDAGIPFQVEENLADPDSPTDWAWRILIRPEDLGRTRRALEVVIEASKPSFVPSSMAAGSNPAPLYNPGGGDWLRPLLVLTCIGLGLLLLFLWR